MTRIIAGRAKGHRLSTPSGERTRPTSDRVREAVFAALAVWAGEGANADEALAGLAFCDLYAGSGAVGLEAASRGAAPVLLVEKDRTTADLARANAAATGLAAEVRAIGVEVLAATAAPRAFDVVWLDPPYLVPTPTVEKVVADLVGRGWLAPNGLLAVERATRDAAPDLTRAGTDAWSRRYGETTVYFVTTGGA